MRGLRKTEAVITLLLMTDMQIGKTKEAHLLLLTHLVFTILTLPQLVVGQATKAEVLLTLEIMCLLQKDFLT